MSDANVTYELVGNIALVGLDRGGKRNALNDDMIKLLREAVFRAGEKHAQASSTQSAINFSAGGLDLAEALSWMDPKNTEAKAKRRKRGRWHRPFDLIARGAIPWIAALKARCIGGGLELASACHIRVADESTFFALPEGQRRLFRRRWFGAHFSVAGIRTDGGPDAHGRVLTAQEGERNNLCRVRGAEG